MRQSTLTKLSLIMAIAIFNRMTAAYSSHMKKNTGPITLFALTTDWKSKSPNAARSSVETDVLKTLPNRITTHHFRN